MFLNFIMRTKKKKNCFISLLFSMLLLQKTTGKRNIGETEFSFDYTKYGKALGTVIRTFKEDGAEKCIYQCLLDNRCESINFDGKTKECELLEENWDTTNVLFTNDDGWVYYGHRKESQKIKNDDDEPYRFNRGGAKFNCKADKCCQEGTSCKEIKEICKNCQTGFYWILLGDEYVKTFCDMESSSGGWMMVGNVSVINEDDRYRKYLTKVQSSDIKSLSNVVAGAYVLSVTALRSLKALTGFTEIRMKCYKPWHNRTFHAILKSPKVVSKLLGEKGSTNLVSCDNTNQVEFLPDDTSMIAKAPCVTLGVESYERAAFYDHSIFIPSKYHVHIFKAERLDCDDFPASSSSELNQRYIGWWQYFVR